MVSRLHMSQTAHSFARSATESLLELMIDWWRSAVLSMSPTRFGSQEPWLTPRGWRWIPAFAGMTKGVSAFLHIRLCLREQSRLEAGD